MEGLFLKSVIAEFRSSGLEEATFGDVSAILQVGSYFAWRARYVFWVFFLSLLFALAYEAVGR